MLPKISSYGKYSSSNYGAHTLVVSIGPYDFFYSYDTVIAFRSPQHGLVCSENVWSVTTGKHLNWITDKSDRVANGEFEEKLNELLNLIEFGNEVVELPLKKSESDLVCYL